MAIPRFWKKASRTISDSNSHERLISAWGWSSESESDALSLAESRLQKIAQRFNCATQSSSEYPYPRTPLREEIIKEIDGGTDRFSVITRNSYGALVLNSSHLYVADIDLATNKPPGWLGRIFGAKKDQASLIQNENQALELLDKFLVKNRGWGFRVYKTPAGLRYIATHASLMASDRRVIDTLRDLGSDPKYIKLCEIQQCFRARLSPKPWRCGVLSAPSRFPYLDGKAAAAMREWQSSYDRSASAYSSCKYIKSIGQSEVQQELKELIRIHDEYCRSNSSLPLA